MIENNEQNLTAETKIPSEQNPNEEQARIEAAATQVKPATAAEYSEAGVSPLKLIYRPVFGARNCYLMAFRTETVVSGLTEGFLYYKDYASAIEKDSCGTALFKWSVEKAIAHANELIESGVSFKWISVKAPARSVGDGDLYETLKRILKFHPINKPEKICIEFPQSVLLKNPDKTAPTFRDLKLLGIKTMISGIGSDDSPVTVLMEVLPDYVMLDNSFTAFVADKNKIETISLFMKYLKSMNITIYADRVSSANFAFDLDGLGVEGVLFRDGYKNADVKTFAVPYEELTGFING